MRFKKIIKLFEENCVSVSGMKGTGKDIFFGNVIARRKVPYVSNLNYGYCLEELKLENLDLHNNYKNWNSVNIIPYNYPYTLGADIYLSDAGIYLPSQYCNQLNKDYEGIISFQALCRQVCGGTRFHFNTQNLNRVWDKIREHSDVYIRCKKCVVLFGIVFQSITIYDKYESCLSRLNPCRVKVPLLGDKNAKMQARLYLDNFYNQHGKVSNRLLIYRNKSKHDTWYFGRLLGTLNKDDSPKKIKQALKRKYKERRGSIDANV